MPFASPLCSAETDDYAEIIDEEDTYTMPSSKFQCTLQAVYLTSGKGHRSSLCTCAFAPAISGPLRPSAAHRVFILVSVPVCAGDKLVEVKRGVRLCACVYQFRLIHCVS